MMPSSSSPSITAGFAGGISGTFTPQPPLDAGTAAVVPPSVCICNRPPGVLLCQTCGFQTVGRAQRVCPMPTHARRLHLMDQSVCAQCFSIAIVELDTDLVDNGKQQQQAHKTKTSI